MRPLRAADENQVLQLVSELYRQHRKLVGFQWPEESLRAEFHSTDGWGTFHGPDIVNFVMYRPTPVAWEISVVASHPAFWGQGLMRSLISHVIVVKPADRELWLEVHGENTGAWKLYESLGFLKTGVRPNYYPDGGTAWMYTLR
jgi:ribosomal-protein-alanine N-acetyltransferase